MNEVANSGGLLALPLVGCLLIGIWVMNKAHEDWRKRKNNKRIHEESMVESPTQATKHIDIKV
jgi:hypothetical protein